MRHEGPARLLQAGELLFRRGEARTRLFLVERGTIALCRKQSDRAKDVVEFAFAGDIIGLGFLATHMFWAMALSTARVRLLPIDARDDILYRSERTKRRYAEAVEREFIARRDELIAAFRAHPARRLAAFLLAVSQLNAHEGRDPCLITDSLRCGTVASCLDMDVDTLATTLVELQEMLLVEHCPPAGLRLTNLAGLSALAKEAPAPRAG